MKFDGLNSFRWQQLGSTDSGGLPRWRRWGHPRPTISASKEGRGVIDSGEIFTYTNTLNFPQ